MKISYKWLKKYAETNLTPEEVSTILTSIGLEVEGFEKIETIRGGLEGIVVGKVLTCEKHPDADKLSVTTVDVGTEVLGIVCGAPNVAAGQKVLVATCGTTLYPAGEAEGFKIKKSKIRGIESNGMICAEDEIGVGTSHDGIMVLPDSVVTGSSAREYFNIEDDYLLEIGLTPNRIDGSSHYGVARDLVAYLKSIGKKAELKLPEIKDIKPGKKERPIEVIVEDSAAAPRYAGVTIRGIKVAPSPSWLQNSLRVIGINPKNNLVDITNFVLHELGQPLHAFDADKVTGDKVIVKKCAASTKFTTLDQVERTLSDEDLMICNTKEPMCIAGVFGGLTSGVTEDTTSVFIESAYFNPVTVRKSAKRHGLNTDASFRFERGTDPNMPLFALKRAINLIQELAGGEVCSDITDIYPDKVEPFKVELSLSRLNTLVGKEIGEDKVKSILKALEIEIKKQTGDKLELAVPPYRVDVRREADVVEDILRIYGYNNIEIPQHVNSTLSYAPRPDKQKLANMVSDMLTAQGFNEIMSNSLTKAAYYENLGSFDKENCVKIVNPLSNDLNVMRQTLLFNALEAVALNSNRKNGDLKMYEFGNCYFYDGSKGEGLAKYSEQMNLAITVTGNQRPASWNVKENKSDFFTLKEYVEKIIKRFDIDINSTIIEPVDMDIYKQGVTLSARGKKLLHMGIVSKSVKNMVDIKSEVFYAEINFERLLEIAKTQKTAASELSKYPEVVRDLALLVDKSVTFAELRDTALKTEKKLLKNVTLFDVYQGDKLPEGKKSYAISLTLEDKTQTLTDKLIDKTMQNIISQLARNHKAEIR